MIFPLKDSIPSINRPYMTWLIIAVTAAVFLWERSLSPREMAAAFQTFGLVPANAANAPLTSTFITYALLHGGWWHVISNMWMFWIFADNIEDVMGPWRFLLYYLACAVISGLTHVFANPAATDPVVGASGAISGILGAYFLLYPHAKITTFVFFLILRIPAALYLGGWFILQLYSGLTRGASDIAWWAHLGGFVAGIALLPLFKAKRAVPAVLPEPPATPQDDPKDPWARYRSK